MYGYIYKTTNKITLDQYIGQHKSEILDENYIGSGSIMKKAIKKYGKENFTIEIIEWCETKEQLNEREIYWIAYYDATNKDNFYNIALGGECGSGAQLKGRKRPNITKALKGRVLSEETKQRISEAKKGIIRSKDAIMKQSITGKGGTSKKHYSAVEDYIPTRDDYIFDFNHREKLSKSHIGNRNKPATPVKCIETDEIFRTMHEAAESVKRSPSNIYMAIKNSSISAGYHWAYVD